MTFTRGTIEHTPKSQLWRVVVIEDNPEDRIEIRRLLLQGSERRYKFVEAETGAEGARSVLDPTDGPPDCVVLDYSLPDTNAVEVLAALVGPDGLMVCPVVVLTGSTGHEQTRAVLRAGAQDYLGKSWMTAESLTRAVENAIERWEMARELKGREASLRASEARFRLAAQVAGLAVAEIDYATDQVHLSPESAALFGLPTDTAIVPRAVIHALFHPDDRPALDQLIAASYDPAGTGEFEMDHRIIRPDGQVRWHRVRKQVFFEQARPARALLAMFDITERKRAEDVSRQNAFLFAKIIEQAPGGVYVVDSQLRVREVNTEALPVFANVHPLVGRELGEVLQILWGPEIGRQCTDIFRHTLETGEQYVSPGFQHLRDDINEQQAYEWETQRITMPDGQHGVVCYFQDVTARELSASALRASQERVRLAAEATGVGIWEWNVITNAIRWDPMMFRIYGIDPTPDGVVSYRDWSGAVLPEDLRVNEAILQDTVRRAGQNTREFRIYRRSDGKCRHIRAVEMARINSAGRTEWVVGTNLDITARKEAELRVRESEQRFRLVADAAPVLIWLRGTDKLCYWFNQPWLAFTGRSMEQEFGDGWVQGVHPDDLDRCLQTYVAAFDARTPFSMQYRLRRHDGEFRWLIDNGVPRYSAGGEFDGYIGSCIDVTDYKTAEAALQDADRRKDEFLATLAHELRNPLAAARSAVKFLEMSGTDVNELQWARDIIDRQTQAMVRLIDDLMDVSRINQGKIELKREHVELAKIVQGAVETCRPLIEEMAHELTVTLPPTNIHGPVILEADLTRMAQVFMNLLNNAAKYTERGGRIHLSAKLEGSEVVVSVKDTGIGIPADKLTGIFEMFSQVQGALSRAQGGLGIGLSLVKRLVEMHGGSIEAKSDGPGQGSEFVARLPIVVEKAYASQASDDVNKATPTSDHRILVVDDHLDSARMLSMLLKRMGHTVHTAHDGEEAVAAAHAFRPHVVLCDIGLPKLNGYEACRLMKQQAWDEKMILIALTGWGQDDDRRKSAEAGFDHHLVKPVDPQALMNLLAGLDAVKT